SSAAWMSFIFGAIMYALFRWRAWRTSPTKDDMKRVPRYGALMFICGSIFWMILFAATFFIYGFLPVYHWWPRSWSVVVALGAVAAIAPVCCWILWRIGRFIFLQGRLPREQREPYYQLIRWGSVIVVGAVFVIGMQSAVDHRFRRW